MGSIEICESGAADCYVEKSGQLLLNVSDAFSSVVPVLLGALVVVSLLLLGR